MKFTRTSRVALLVAVALPFVTHAQTISTIPNLFLTIISWINGIFVPLIFAIAFVAFLIGIYYYFIQSAGNAEKTKEGRSFLMWSLIGFFIMFSVWGLINLFLGTLGFNYSTQPGIPQFHNTTANGTTQAGTANTVAPTNGSSCPFGYTFSGNTCVQNPTSSVANAGGGFTNTSTSGAGSAAAPFTAANGQFCTLNTDCQSGTCVAGACAATYNANGVPVTACTPSDPSCPPNYSCNFSTGKCDSN